MSADLWVDICSNLVMLSVAIYAIRDTRTQTRRMVLLERNRVYAKVRADLAWQFIDPTEHAQSTEIAKALEEFCITAQEADPQWAVEDMKVAADNEGLHFADTLVKSGYATWKEGLSPAKVAERLRAWEADKNRERIKNLFGRKNDLFLL
jgi:hypothetical protein